MSEPNLRPAVVDTSALYSVLTKQAGFERHLKAMADAPSLHISAATLLELCIVADHRDVTQLTRARIDQFVDLLGMTVEPFDEAQYLVARDGHANYSSKRKGLNFGDCFAYALAKTLRATLIYEGQDFANTDVQRGAVDRDEAQS